MVWLDVALFPNRETAWYETRPDSSYIQSLSGLAKSMQHGSINWAIQ